MSFWQLSNGNPVTGNEKDAFVSSFGIIPDGTCAEAIILKFYIDSSRGKPLINIHWRLTKGEFEGRTVFHKLACWDDKPAKADRSKNMLLLIFKLLSHSPQHQGEPTDRDLSVLIGRSLGIKILEYVTKDGKEGNYVGEVHKIDHTFQTVTGEKKVVTGKPAFQSPVDTAYSRNGYVDNTVDDLATLPF